MKTYFNISIILLLSFEVIAAEITPPTISEDIKQIAEQTAHDRNTARVSATLLSAPVIDDALKDSLQQILEQLEKRQVNQQSSVKNLLDETVNNPVWRNKQQVMINKLSDDLGIDIAEETTQSLSGYRLYLFTSSSVPKDKNRDFVRQLSNYDNAQVVMRGFIGGAKKIVPTMAYIKSLLNKNPNCQDTQCKTHPINVNIDPVLFQRYQVDRVPTLVYVDKVSGGSWCSEGNAEVVKADGVHKFIGKAPVKYMLRRLAEETKLPNLIKLTQTQ